MTRSRGSAFAGTALLCVLAGMRCGGDGQPVPPPPLPTVPASPTAPDPARPESPARVTGIKATEIGQDFILWTWDPAEGATSYEADVAPGQPLLRDA